MLQNLSSGSFFLLIGSILIAGFLFAWAADAVMGNFGFGVIGTTCVASAAAYGSLMLMDWAIEQNRLPYGYQTPQHYVAAAMLGTTLATIFCGLLKRLLIR